MELHQLEELALSCAACPLAETRTNVVFGKGNPHAAVLFLGEGPGADEDKQGQPFVGRAGQLLDRIIAAAELPLTDVYICNVVKCRPPGNRVPNPGEVLACAHFWQQQIQLVDPAIVVCLGATATQALLDPKAKITQVRGTWVERETYRIMPTFHPAALLRDETKKRPVWEDMKQVRDYYHSLQKTREDWPPST